MPYLPPKTPINPVLTQSDPWHRRDWPRETTLAEAERFGANARARGESNNCPYYASSECPAATGEPVEQWEARVEAWELGWWVEDAIRA